eukprot:4700754-Lingulodinium_polyedra.AAC.1
MSLLWLFFFAAPQVQSRGTPMTPVRRKSGGRPGACKVPTAASQAMVAAAAATGQALVAAAPQQAMVAAAAAAGQALVAASGKRAAPHQALVAASGKRGTPQKALVAPHIGAP